MTGCEHIGESSRTFGERFKEHLKALSQVYDPSNTTGHVATVENFSIVEREDQNLTSTIIHLPYCLFMVTITSSTFGTTFATAYVVTQKTINTSHLLDLNLQ